MNRLIQGNGKEEFQGMNKSEPAKDSVIDSGPGRKLFELVPWLAAALCIFALLFSSSYFALRWLPSYQEVDMTSHLHADYGVWDFLIFQPVDPALIDEIIRERGLPDQIVIDGSNWRTPLTPLAVEPSPSSTPQVTHENIIPSSSPSQTPYSPSPEPTGISTLPESTETPPPTVVIHPTKSRKPHKTPKPDKPPKTP
jgi:hypothetical protein